MKHFYITYLKHKNTTDNINFKSIINNITNPVLDYKKTTEYWTITDDTFEKYKQNDKIKQYENWLKNLQVPETSDIKYKTFYIDKKSSNSKRRIDAPDTILKSYMTNVKTWLEMFPVEHDNAFAYIKNKSVITTMQKHQQNESKYFIKIDIKDFFNSCSFRFVIQTLTKIYPFALLDRQSLEEKLAPCFKNNVLPQGSPTSPILSNIVMLPFDFQITNTLSKFNNGFCYTRYADDIIISAKTYFNPNKIVKIINNLLGHTPLKINLDKLRFGSINGKNWNLGIMLNKDNILTPGHVNKRNLNTIINAILNRIQNEEPNPDLIQEVSKLKGLIAWYDSIEENCATAKLNTIKTKKNIPQHILKQYNLN